jgi:hypothetical protein
MQVTAPIYEKPSRLSQGLVVGLSIAVVAMAGWLAMTIITPPTTTASGSETDATAGTPVSAPVSPTEGSAASGAARSLGPAARSVQFDWPEQFNTAPPPTTPRAALPLAPVEVPVARAAGGAVGWPAVPDAGDRIAPARQPASPAGNAAAGTDAIIDILTAPSASVPRPAPARR